jgi:hypothetical protein
MSTTDNAPPLYPKIPRKQLAKMSPRQQGEHAQRVAIQAIKRYGGHPELTDQERLLEIRSILRKKRIHIGIVREKVSAGESFPAPLRGWSWRRVLDEMEAAERALRLRARGLARAIRKNPQCLHDTRNEN